MTYTWTTQIHNTTAARNGIQVETWAQMSRGWVNIDIVDVDTLDEAHEVAKAIRMSRTFRAPTIIAAVQFEPASHHRLVTCHNDPQ